MDAGADPCSVPVTTRGGKWQMWFCHAACFRAQLAKLADHQGLIEPVHF